MNKPHGEPVATGVRLGDATPVSFVLPVETPLGLVYNDLSYAVMMATPDDLKDFALGFSLSEGVINQADELLSMVKKQRKNGLELRLGITAKRFERLKLHTRNRAHFARSGCGLCGIDDLNDAIRPLPKLAPSANKTSASAMLRAVNELEQAQPLRATNRSVHGAAFVASDGQIIIVREDIGRHNALDKLIGAGARLGLDWESGFVLLSSRCTYELVQKCAIAGISTMACLSAPSAAAIKTAQKTSIGLAIFERQSNGFIAFADIDRFVI